jgi:hypothetical protein
MTNEELYGFNDTRISSYHWNINITKVVQGSYYDWFDSVNESAPCNYKYAYRAGTQTIEQMAGMHGVRLPVCVSKYTTITDYSLQDVGMKHKSHGRHFPCNCGNDWGDDNQLVYRTDPNWFTLEAGKAGTDRSEYINMCIKEFKDRELSKKPAKYAVNL